MLCYYIKGALTNVWFELFFNCLNLCNLIHAFSYGLLTPQWWLWLGVGLEIHAYILKMKNICSWYDSHCTNSYKITTSKKTTFFCEIGLLCGVFGWSKHGATREVHLPHFPRWNPVILKAIHTTGNVAQGRKTSPCRFCKKFIVI